MDFSLMPNLEDSARISRSMRVLSYEEAKEGVSRYIEEPLKEKGELTQWDLSFAEYIEEHKNSKLIFCQYGKSVAIIFSPADHHGIWAMHREGTSGKGIVADHYLSRGSGEEERFGLNSELVVCRQFFFCNGEFFALRFTDFRISKIQ